MIPTKTNTTELTVEQLEQVAGGGGKVQMQDIHFASAFGGGGGAGKVQMQDLNAFGGGGGAGKVSMQDLSIIAI